MITEGRLSARESPVQVLVCALQVVVDGVCVAAGAGAATQDGQRGSAWGLAAVWALGSLFSTLWYVER